MDAATSAPSSSANVPHRTLADLRATSIPRATVPWPAVQPPNLSPPKRYMTRDPYLRPDAIDRVLYGIAKACEDDKVNEATLQTRYASLSMPLHTANPDMDHLGSVTFQVGNSLQNLRVIGGVAHKSTETHELENAVYQANKSRTASLPATSLASPRTNLPSSTSTPTAESQLFSDSPPANAVIAGLGPVSALPRRASGTTSAAGSTGSSRRIPGTSKPDLELLAVVNTLGRDPPDEVGGWAHKRRKATRLLTLVGEVKKHLFASGSTAVGEKVKDCLAQLFIYAVTTHEICGTWLGLAVVNTKFARAMVVGVEDLPHIDEMVLNEYQWWPASAATPDSPAANESVASRETAADNDAKAGPVAAPVDALTAESIDIPFPANKPVVIVLEIDGCQRQELFDVLGPRPTVDSVLNLAPHLLANILPHNLLYPVTARREYLRTQALDGNGNTCTELVWDSIAVDTLYDTLCTAYGLAYALPLDEPLKALVSPANGRYPILLRGLVPSEVTAQALSAVIRKVRKFEQSPPAPPPPAPESQPPPDDRASDPPSAPGEPSPATHSPASGAASQPAPHRDPSTLNSGGLRQAGLGRLATLIARARGTAPCLSIAPVSLADLSDPSHSTYESPPSTASSSASTDLTSSSSSKAGLPTTAVEPGAASTGVADAGRTVEGPVSDSSPRPVLPPLKYPWTDAHRASRPRYLSTGGALDDDGAADGDIDDGSSDSSSAWSDESQPDDMWMRDISRMPKTLLQSPVVLVSPEQMTDLVHARAYAL
ncbi:hypothetical protein Q5752_007128 [Cryptotrichosporon argae]